MKRNQTKNLKYFDNFQYLVMAKLFDEYSTYQTQKLEKKIMVLYTSKYNIYLLTLTSSFIFLKWLQMCIYITYHTDLYSVSFVLNISIYVWVYVHYVYFNVSTCWPYNLNVLQVLPGILDKPNNICVWILYHLAVSMCICKCEHTNIFNNSWFHFFILSLFEFPYCFKINIFFMEKTKTFLL